MGALRIPGGRQRGSALAAPGWEQVPRNAPRTSCGLLARRGPRPGPDSFVHRKGPGITAGIHEADSWWGVGFPSEVRARAPTPEHSWEAQPRGAPARRARVVSEPLSSSQPTDQRPPRRPPWSTEPRQAALGDKAEHGRGRGSAPRGRERRRGPSAAGTSKPLLPAQ